MRRVFLRFTNFSGESSTIIVFSEENSGKVEYTLARSLVDAWSFPLMTLEQWDLSKVNKIFTYYFKQ